MKVFLPGNFTKIFLSACILIVFNSAVAQVSVQLSTPVISGLTQPMQIVSAHDGTGRHFVVQKQGAILVYDENFAALGTFLTVTGLSTSGEQGLLSMVFDPDYATNGYFYVYYNNALGNLELARYEVSAGNPNQADVSSTVVLQIDHPTYSNHNGSEMHFGSDGYLYISTGDGGGGGDPNGNGQNPASLLGKMLRLQLLDGGTTGPYYTIPPGNPGGTLVYQMGLRNPYRWSFDRLTGDMWIGDVGQNNWEEIDFQPAASLANTNWGWSCYEGNQTYNAGQCSGTVSYTMPVHVYSNGQSITGGVVYRGALHPGLIGQYIAADHYSGNFYHIVPNGAGGFTTLVQTALQTGIVDFGEDEAGEVFAVSLTAGNVYRVLPEATTPVNLVSFQAVKWNDAVRLYWTTAQESLLENYVIEYSTDGHNFSALTTITPQNNPQGAMYRYDHTDADKGNIFYRLRIDNLNGHVQYSAIRRVHFTGKDKQFVASNYVRDRNIQIILPEGYKKLEVLNSAGAVMVSKNITDQSGSASVYVPGTATGIYLVVLRGDSHFVTEKILME